MGSSIRQARRRRRKPWQAVWPLRAPMTLATLRKSRSGLARASKSVSAPHGDSPILERAAHQQPARIAVMAATVVTQPGWKRKSRRTGRLDRTDDMAQPLCGNAEHRTARHAGNGSLRSAVDRRIPRAMRLIRVVEGSTYDSPAPDNQAEPSGAHKA